MKTPFEVNLCSAVAMVFLATSLADAQSSFPSDNKASMTRIHLIIRGERLFATLDDTAAAKDFAALLPLELTLDDFHGIEKVADLPRRLDTSDAPASYKPEAGDITYYAPWGNLAIFYRPFRDSAGLVRLGSFDGALSKLLNDGQQRVRFEIAR